MCSQCEPWRKLRLYLNGKYNIFTQVVGGRAPSDPSMTERMMLMSTYEELMVILTTVSLIVAILNMNTMRNVSISHVRERRQMGMQAFPHASCFRANKK